MPQPAASSDVQDAACDWNEDRGKGALGEDDDDQQQPGQAQEEPGDHPSEHPQAANGLAIQLDRPAVRKRSHVDRGFEAADAAAAQVVRRGDGADDPS